MRLPSQARALQRAPLKARVHAVLPVSAVAPACDPNTQISCGDQLCCSKYLYFCVDGQCQLQS